MPRPADREIRRLRSLFWSERDPEGRGFAPLADAYRRAGDYDEAVDLIREGLDRLPSFATGHVVAGWVHRERGGAEAEAEAAFRRALELDEENVSALRGLGFILADSGRVAEAREVFEHLAELEPDDPEVKARLLELERADAPGEAAAAEAGAPAVEEGEPAAEPVGSTGDADEAEPDEREPEEVAAETVEETAAPEEGAAAPDEEAGADQEVEELYASAFGVSDRGERESREYVDGGEEMETVEVELDGLQLDEQEPEPEEPAAEPAMDMADLAPDEPEDVQPEADEEPVELADLAPDGLADEAAKEPAAEPAIDMADLAPDESETPDEPEPEEPAAEPTMELADLAPDEPEDVQSEADEEPVELADLAPDGLADEAAKQLAAGPAIDMADLAPDEPEDVQPEADEEPVELADLAPDGPADEAAKEPAAEPAIDMADLAPDEPETSDEPEPEEPAAEPTMELADLAPDGPADEAAKEPAAEPAMDMADLAPDEPETSDEPEPEEPAAEPAMDMADLAPDEPEDVQPEADEEPVELAEQPDPEPGPRTRTMAELYARQGLTERAVAVYEKLVEKNPGDAELAARLDELRGGSGDEELRESSETADFDDPVEAVEDTAPSAAVAGDIDDPVALDVPQPPDQEPEVETPFAWTRDDVEPTDVPADERPVRDYFRALLGGDEPGESQDRGAAPS